MALRDAAYLLVGILLLSHTWGASAAVQVDMVDKVEVVLGKTAQITCKFTSDDGIGAMIIKWFYVTRASEKQRIYYQDATRSLVERDTLLSDRMSVNSSVASGETVLTITDVQLEDELQFICLVKSLTDGTLEGRTRLRVFKTPDKPSIEGTETGVSVNDGLSKIGTCEVKNGFPKPNVTWYRNTTPLRNVHEQVDVVSTITTESSGLYSVKSELMMQVAKEDKDAEFYCEVTYFIPGEPGMMETSRINVTVYYPHDAINIWLESPKGKIKEGDTMKLRCDGDGNSPSTIFTIRHVEEDSSWETDVLVVENVTQLNGGVYQCDSMDIYSGVDISRNTSVFIHYLHSAVVKPDDTLVEVYGRRLEATCNALSSLQTHTAWFKDEQQVSSGHTLVLEDVTFSTSGVYTCVVTVPEVEGMQTSKTVNVIVEGPPIITEEDKEMDSYEKTMELTCHARGHPTPEMSWTTSDGKEVKTTPTETEDGFQSKFTVQVDADVNATCRASNSYGAAAVTFSITAITYTTPATTTTTTTITITTTTTTTITPTTVETEKIIPAKDMKKGGNGVIIAVIIICILLLAILGSVLYFLYKKGKICGRSGKQDLTKEKSSKDNIVVEMKSDNTEEAILLGVNGEKQPSSDP